MPSEFIPENGAFGRSATAARGNGSWAATSASGADWEIKMRRNYCTALVVGAALLLLVSARSGHAAVTVDAYTGVTLGEQTEISANLFGITSFEGFPSVIANGDYRARLEALRPGCVRFGGNIAWCAPKEYDPAWYETPAAAREFSQVLLFGSRYPTGRFLPVVRQMGAEPMCSLAAPPPYLTQEGTHHPSDFDRWAATCAGYVGLWRKFDPGLRLVQIWNEPNASWYRDPRAGKDLSDAGLHIRMANKVSKAIKERFPDILIGGPVLCWPPAWPPSQQGQRPWYTWESWTLPWLRETKGTVDFFDFHVYDVSPEDFAVQTGMVANQALLTQGRRLPVWITESNTNLKPEELNDAKAIWAKRILPYERLLLRGILPNADKIDGNLYHDLHARNHTLLPRGADDPDPAYWLFWVLRDLRGRRVIADSTDPEVVSYATLEEDRVTIVLFNDGEQAKELPLAVSMPCGYWTGPEVRAIGPGDDATCRRLEVKPELKRNGGKAEGSVSLPARATVSISFRLDNFATPRAARLRREHFGDATLQFLKADAKATVSIALPELPKAGAKAWLRVGLLGPEGTEALAATLNGKEIPLEPTALQEISLDAGALGATNRLVVGLGAPVDNPRLALGFASIIVETTR